MTSISLNLDDGNRSLTAATGEITLLTGPVGSGKSLWLERLAGLRPLPAGIACTLAGKPWPDRKNSAAVRLLPDLYPHLFLGQTVAEELTFGLTTGPTREQLQAALAAWGLAGLPLSGNVRSLNRIQSLRLLLAGMTLAAPALVLLDNPVAALPAAEAETLQREIRDWAARDKLVVVVACNRWQDWQPWVGQTWRLDSPDALPAAEVVHG